MAGTAKVMRTATLAATFAFALNATAQQPVKFQHEVKKKETIFGIANQNGLTVQELIDANPKMKEPGFELKKGDVINIPYTATEYQEVKKKQAATATTTTTTAATKGTKASKETDPRKREVRVGVVLPLHDVDGDGRRMVEYYRGLLMACDSIKREGVSVNVHAWNLNIEGDASKIIKDPSAAECDIIFGPLYTKQVKALGDFALKNDIKLVIPFSISSDEVLRNRNIFQVYQNDVDFSSSVIEKYMERFKDYHAIFIDCNDAESKKGIFTIPLRRTMEQKGTDFSITNLTSDDLAFQKAFSNKKKNMVILNSGKSPELRAAIAKLDKVKSANPSMEISIFGYTEWLMYEKYNIDNFHKYDVYIPTSFYYNPNSSRVKRIEQRYRWAFHEDMQQALPRFAITGFDQGYYFLRGLHLYGKEFYGNTGVNGNSGVQTPYHFKRNSGGGLQNTAFMFVHYIPGGGLESMNF